MIKLYQRTLSLCLITLLFFISACSTPRPQGKTEAEVLFKEANDLIEKGRYLLATERLNTLRSQYPYSFYSTHAELLQADILFRQENYIEAAASYILFKDFHPKHKDSAYVLWRIGESFFNQLPSTYDRDLGPGLEAIKYYKDLVTRFPNAKEKKEAEEKIAHITDLLIKKEQYIADFYFKTDVFDAARFRYLHIISKTVPKEIHGHAASRVVISSFNIGDFKGCVKYSDSYMPIVSKEFQETIKDFKLKCTSSIK